MRESIGGDAEERRGSAARGRDKLDREATRVHRSGEAECGLAEMLVAEFADDSAGVIEHAEGRHAERRNGLGVQHEHGFERVVEVGIEVEFEARDFHGLGPRERERGRGIGEGGEPNVGLARGAAETVVEIFGGEERDGRLDAEREIFSTGAALRNPELKAFDAGAGRWLLAGRFGDGAVEFLGDGENAREALIAEVGGDRGIGGEADEGVARGID